MDTSRETKSAEIQESDNAVILDSDSRLAEANAIVVNNVKWASGVGAVPMPLVEIAGVTAVQIRMLRQLSELYRIPFREHRGKNIVASLFAGLGSARLGMLVGASLAKFIPFVGPAIGLVATPAAAGALTYATGKVFIQHFESGGTFLDFDPVKAREFFKREYDAARESPSPKASKSRS